VKSWAYTAVGSVSNSVIAQAVLKRPASVFGWAVFAIELFVFIFLPGLDVMVIIMAVRLGRERWPRFGPFTAVSIYSQFQNPVNPSFLFAGRLIRTPPKFFL
jgi:hypothetical protein